MTQISPQASDTGIFIPRSADPAVNASGSPYWTNAAGGGYGGAWSGRNNPWLNSTLYNCTSYAYGRLLEILNTSFATQFNANLFNCFLYFNADTWYAAGAAAGWDVSQTPQLGGVMCWSSPNYEGHIAIVEEIGSNYIKTSEGHWYAGNYTYNTRYNDGHWSQGSDALYQGCIIPFNFSGSSPAPPVTRTKSKWIYYLKHLPH